MSRVTNAAARGSVAWLDGEDRRSPLARRFADLVALFSQDLGGAANLPEAKRQAIRRMASIALWCETQDTQLVDGKAFDIVRYCTASNTQKKLCEQLGWDFEPQDITEAIDDLVRQKAREGATDAEDGGDA